MNNFLESAYNIALDVEPFANARIAAILVHRNRIISIGTNWSKTHPIALKFQKNKKATYPHAEVVCLHNAHKRGFDQWAKATLFIARVRKIDGKIVQGNCRPCHGCFSAIEHFGVGKIVWTGDAGSCSLTIDH